MLTASQMEPNAQSRLEGVGPLRQIRAGFGLGLRQVADHFGVTPSSMMAWETGGRPSIENALRLARFYETTVEELFGHLIEKED